MNQTADEAINRVHKAMKNSLAEDPSLEYLDALQAALSEWAKYAQWLIDDKKRGTAPKGK